MRGFGKRADNARRHGVPILRFAPRRLGPVLTTVLIKRNEALASSSSEPPSPPSQEKENTDRLRSTSPVMSTLGAQATAVVTGSFLSGMGQ